MFIILRRFCLSNFVRRALFSGFGCGAEKLAIQKDALTGRCQGLFPPDLQSQ